VRFLTGMKANLQTGIITAALATSFALGQTRYGNANDPNVGQNATAQGTQTANPNKVGGSDSQKPQPSTPKWNPGFGEQVPNKELSGGTPATNSTLQKDRDGNMGDEYFGWLGLVGLAGLFGLSRGTNPSPRPDITDEKTLKHPG
jgi:hypothetical protein